VDDAPVVYVVRVRGELAPHWAAWFGGMAVTVEGDGTTTLTGHLADQAALHGVLRKVRDLGLTLLTVERQDGGGEGSPLDERPSGSADAARGEQ
jgi:hypothetical protein